MVTSDAKVILSQVFMASSAPISVRTSAEPIHKVDERYVSFTIDLGQIAEPTRFWNPDGSGETVGRPSYDFANERIRRMAGALSPAYIRIGGTEADRVLYALNTTYQQPPPPFQSVLTTQHIDALGAFALAAGLQVSFTVNAGWGARNGDGRWDSTQTRALMRYVREHALPFTVFELGNEPNAWPLFQKNLKVEPEDYARDLLELSLARDAEAPGALICGPSTAYWPSIGEVPAFTLELPPRLIRDYLPRALRAAEELVVPDIVSWHYYPGLSTRSALAKYRPQLPAVGLAVGLALAALVSSRRLLSAGGVALLLTLLLLATALACAINAVVRPVHLTSLRTVGNLDTVGSWAAEVNAAVAALQPDGGAAPAPAIWLGETGSAQVGGQPGVSGRWASTLWWLDQLGLLATMKHSVQCRQTLSGADYGLIDDATLEPTPDYWASVLWRRLMGTSVFAVESPGAPPTLRLYAHSAATPPSAGAQRGLTYLAINLGESPLELDLDLARPAETWLLEGPSLDARTCTVNGEQAASAVDGTAPEFAPVLTTRPTVPAGAALFARVWQP